jgi:outer membrane protein TolC
MKRILGAGPWLVLVSCMIPAGIRAQEPLTLRHAIQIALKQSPDVDVARAEVEEAKASASVDRTQYLP